MKTKLPDVLEGYFDAVNREDIDAMLAPFAANAVVKDERKTRTGRLAVREWIDEVTEKYHPRFDVEDVVDEGEETVVVTGRVSGAFPGSPVRLRYAFRLSARKITHLEIS
jgi:ketosteroid isomerase-like protein